MYYPVNNFNNCSIFKKSLFQDLENYNLNFDNNMNLLLRYDGDTTDHTVNINISPLLDLVLSAYTPETENVWQPAFMTTDSDVTHNHISRKTINSNPIFGVSNIISYPPKFKSWDIVNHDSNPATMRSDWHINSIMGSPRIAYGLMFWYKYTNFGYSNIISFENLLPNTKFILSMDIGNTYITIPKNTPLQKINDNTFKILNNKQAIFTSNTNIANSNSIRFNDEIYLVNVSSITTNQNELISNCRLHKDNAFIKNNKNLDLYISNGECFSYFYGKADELRSIQNRTPTRTYLSPALRKVYREAHHRLTLHKNKSPNPSMNRYSSRLFQKLCYYLSSGPLMDRTTIDILADKEVFDRVQTFINLPYASPSNEITNLKNILNFIYTKYQNLSVSYYDQTLSNNYVSTKKDLFQAITSKYGCSLWIPGKTSLKFKKPLENGPHAFLSTNYQNWRPKNLANTDISFNNNSIKIGNFLYATDISSTKSTIKVKADNWGSNTNLEIPLADISLIKDNPGSLYLGSGIYVSGVPNQETQFSTDGLMSSVSSDRNESYFWEQISGPNCLRFDDNRKDRLRLKRFKNSTSPDPGIYVKQSGTYEVKCTRFNFGNTDTDTLTLTTDSSVSLSGINGQLDPPGPYPKIMTSNIKSIAFNKKGLIWAIDSENYIDTDDINDRDDINKDGILFFKDIKFDINNKEKVNIQKNNANLEMIFDMTNGNCATSLFSLTIENMRDEKYKYGQCKSFYQEKLKRKRSTSINQTNFGNNDFLRDLTFVDKTLMFNNVSGTIIGSGVTLITTSASTQYAPPILPYGGYGKNIVDTIGISMMGHPQPQSGYLPVPVEPITNALPIITDRNSVLKEDQNNLIACHLREVSPTGNKHYVDFVKGHFHPISGWLTTQTSLNGKSNVVINKPELKNSFKFEGIGFSSLRSLSGNNKSTVYKSSIEVFGGGATKTISHYGFYNANTNPKYNPNYSIYDIQDDWGNMYSSNSTSCGLATRQYGVDSIVSNKTIQSIEVQLSFLNHINPKNLAVWLDVTNATNPISGTIDLSSSGVYLDSQPVPGPNADLNNYLSSLKISNSGESCLRLYLLNQENISNYTTNFSIKFSDYANKMSVIDKNDYHSSIQNLDIINNNQQIIPSLSAVSGYNDIGISEYTKAIKNNQINVINNTLMKFKDIRLHGTTFTLNIANIEPLENDDSSMDNLLNNSILNNNTFFDNNHYSDRLTDSLCKWSIIVHTTGTRDTVDSDTLGYIDYKNSISGLALSGYGIDSTSDRRNLPLLYNGIYTPINPSGYDFIGDFTDKNFLIPLVNQNAPYQSLADTRQCLFDDPDIPKFVSSTPPAFPSLISYALIGANAAQLSSAGLVGSMVGLTLASQALSQGGRSDPIISYLMDVKNYERSVLNNSQFYKPVYSEETYGYADRAIVSLSKDSAIWYDVEVPIFKYSNTPLVHKNVYKYIKLDGSSPSDISRFTYKTINHFPDLDLANVVARISENVENKNGFITINNLALSKNDIVLLSNQTTESDNAYWIVSSGSWIKVPSTESLHYMSYNKISSQFSQSIYNSSTINQNIMIDGIRAYNFFDVGEAIELTEPSGSTANILDKSLIATNSGQKTILTVSSVIEQDGSIFKPASSANVLFLYKDASSTIDSRNNFPFNLWSLESSDSYDIKPQSPTMRVSTIGEGSIGRGTDSIFPSPVSRSSLVDNLLLQKNDIFDNSYNDLYKLHKLTVVDHSNNVTNINPTTNDDAANKIKASAYSYDNAGLIYNNISDAYHEDGEVNAIMKNIYSSATSDKKNKVLIDLKSDRFINLPSSGYITLEGDSLFYKSISFTNNNITLLNSRLSDLSASNNNFQPSSVTDIYSINSIKDLIKYHDSLVEDPIRSMRPNRSSSVTIHKLLAKKRIKELYQEKISIENAIAVNYPNLEKAHISGVVTNHLPTGLIIDYKENNDLYWIHIDPSQTCKLNDELTVKVLTTSIFYPLALGSTAGFGTLTAKSVINPERFELSSPPSPPTNPDINYQRSSTQQINYVVPESKVQQNKTDIKNKYPSLVWNDDETFRYGRGPAVNSASKKLIINDGENIKDYVIQTEEVYIRPSGLINMGRPAISSVIDLANTNNLKIKFRNLPRKINSIDSIGFKKYTYDTDGSLVPDTSFAVGSIGKIENNFVCWHCINQGGVYVTGIPPFLVAANEMRYRAFFGSIDGIENKNTFVSDCQEDWEWIPFEYYNDPILYFRGGTPTVDPPAAPGPPLDNEPESPSYDFDDARNWFLDSDYNTPANRLPEEDARVFIRTKVTGGQGRVGSLIVDSDDEFKASVFAQTSVEFKGSSKNEGSITVDVDGTVTFNENSENKGQISIMGSEKGGGVVIFNGSSVNREDSINVGGPEGIVVFHEQSLNFSQIFSAKVLFDGYTANALGGVIHGSAVFSDRAINYGDALGSTVFNDSAINQGKISGRVVFNDGTENKEVIIARPLPYSETNPDSRYWAIFKGDSKNTGTIKSYLDDPLTTVKNGGFSIKFADNSLNNKDTQGSCFFFDSAINGSFGSISYGVFTGNTINRGRISASSGSSFAEFSENSINEGEIDTASTYFRGESINKSNVYCSEWITFEGSSINTGYINSKQINFKDESKNQSIIHGEAVEFSDKSVSDGLAPQGASIKSKSIRFIGESGNKGILNVELTIDDVIDTADSNFIFIGLWFFHNSSNKGTLFTLRAIPKLKDQSSNKGTIMGDARFYEQATNQGTVTGLIYEDRSIQL